MSQSIATKSREPDSQVGGCPDALATLSQLIGKQLESIVLAQKSLHENKQGRPLHQFRVGTRRLRSLISGCQELLPAKKSQAWLKELKKIGRATGPARDCDVYLSHIPGYEALFPSEANAPLKALSKLLTKRQRKTYADVRKQIKQDPWQKTLQEMSRYSSKHQSSEHDAPPTKTFAQEKIAEAYAELIQLGQSITADSPNEDLHTIRKQGKKLRYLLEFFSPWLTMPRYKGTVRELKRLQDYLGKFQDLDLQSVKMREFANDLMDCKHPDVETILNIGFLRQTLRQKLKSSRDQFPRVFDQFVARTGDLAF